MPIQARASTVQDPRVRRVEFDLDGFEQQLDEHGYFVRWSKAMMCPNRDPDQEDHHVINCTLCDTNGFIYFDPKDVIVLVTSYGMKQLFMPESRYEPGTAYFTALPEHKLSFWDKIELLDASTRFSEVKRVVPVGLNYRFRYPVLSIEHLANDNGKPFSITSAIIQSDGSVTFSEKPPGSFFAISYFYHPTYIMIDMLHSVRDSRITVRSKDVEADFPTQAVGRLEFLVKDEAAE
jgi:hypothetical protein